MSDLANVNAGAAGLAPPGAQDVPYVVDGETAPRLVVRSGGPTDPSRVLARPLGIADRPQSMDVGFWRRPWSWWANLTGAHGVVGEAPAVPDQTGGQHAWPNYSRRTFRQAPTVPWDHEEGDQRA